MALYFFDRDRLVANLTFSVTNRAEDMMFVKAEFLFPDKDGDPLFVINAVPKLIRSLRVRHILLPVKRFWKKESAKTSVTFAIKLVGREAHIISSLMRSEDPVTISTLRDL